jgi:NAD(P)-dependent dehydrogenase (short-subunit alcohol dehydrogenase family)
VAGGLTVLKGIAGGTAVVTGAAGGIGTQVCRRLLAEGANVVAVDIDEGALGKLAAELTGPLATVAADVTTAEDTERFMDAAVDRFGSVDMFHANAGIEGVVAPVASLDIADVERVFAVNVRSAFLGIGSAVRRMTDQPNRGRILVTASIAGLKGDAGVAPYVASKHAVIGMVRSLTKEIGPLGIRVNVLAPGVVETRMMDSLEVGLGALAGVDGAGIKAALNTAVPLGRYAHPEEIAATAAWLLSDEVPYMHGEVVTVGGGLWP